MKDEDYLIVEEYLYGSEEDVNLAKEEKKKARYLETRIDYEDIETALKIYETAIKQKFFKTPTGIDFLKKMRYQLIKNGVSADSISPIPLYHIFSKEEDNRPVRIFKVQEKEDNSKEVLRKSLWLNLALIFLVIGMFLITMFGSNTNILNYKYKIENEYSVWKQELEEKEAALREKEEALKQDSLLSKP